MLCFAGGVFALARSCTCCTRALRLASRWRKSSLTHPHLRLDHGKRTTKRHRDRSSRRQIYMMRGIESVRHQPAIGSCCKHRHARQTCAGSTRPMCSIRSNDCHSSPLHAQPRSLVTGRHQERAFLAEQDRFRLSAASPALDSSGGDEPPIVHNTKAVGEEDDDDSHNNSAKDIDSILAKAGSSSSELPADMQAALARGALLTSDVRLWLKLVSTPLVGSLCKLVPAFRSRMLGNSRFLMVLAIEEAIGVAAKWSAEKSSRKDKFWKEFDFVLSDMALEVIGDFAVVWLLSPTRSFTPRAKSGLARYINALPGHALQVGKFKPAQRAAVVAYRGAQFFGVSFVASMVGHSLTKYMVDRSRVQSTHVKAEGEEADKELAPVLDNSIAWGGFVASSTNLRYQLVNGCEERVLDAYIRSPVLKSGLIFIIRFGNTFWGGAQWVQYAKLIGIQ